MPEVRLFSFACKLYLGIMERPSRFGFFGGHPPSGGWFEDKKQQHEPYARRDAPHAPSLELIFAWKIRGVRLIRRNEVGLAPAPPIDGLLLKHESNNLVWQQDGAPSHGHVSIRDWLNITVPNQWIGPKEPPDKACIAWPPRSPDLTPCDFYLWGVIKACVHVLPLQADLSD
ncbi:uncharacterized protein TNCV_2206521 [Trichonephila clavipes]|uniref:Uncharacterized protein n=1 Tax=Trichonephila clavipes TaxID=2585209 RepID=A0A8X6S3P4_TRICX|nr:uncharacterized protein TNCV_2206521 [Trichonephila clavipes]